MGQLIILPQNADITYQLRKNSALTDKDRVVGTYASRREALADRQRLSKGNTLDTYFVVPVIDSNEPLIIRDVMKYCADKSRAVVPT